MAYLAYWVAMSILWILIKGKILKEWVRNVLWLKHTHSHAYIKYTHTHTHQIHTHGYTHGYQLPRPKIGPRRPQSSNLGSSSDEDAG